jgi:hypothetical protein
VEAALHWGPRSSKQPKQQQQQQQQSRQQQRSQRDQQQAEQHGPERLGNCHSGDGEQQRM